MINMREDYNEFIDAGGKIYLAKDLFYHGEVVPSEKIVEEVKARVALLRKKRACNLYVR